jgi:hypothetical protein
MYSLAMTFLFKSIEKIGQKIILAKDELEAKEELKAPTFMEYYSNPKKYKNRRFF